MESMGKRPRRHRSFTAEQAVPEAGDPALLDQLPVLGDILTGAPTRLQQQLHQAFSLQAVYKYETRQVTIYADITASTPATLADHNGPQPAGTATATSPQFSVFTTSPYKSLLNRAVKRNRVAP